MGVTTASSTQDSILLIDGHSMAYRAYHALPPEKFSTADGQTTNAVFGFISMLLTAIEAESPTHIAVAFDRGRRRRTVFFALGGVFFCAAALADASLTEAASTGGALLYLFAEAAVLLKPVKKQ